MILVARGRDARTGKFASRNHKRLTVSFKENRDLVQNLEKSRMVGKPIKDKVEEAADIAIAIAPVKTGAYRDGIKADQVFSGNRLISRLNAYDFKSHWIEFGTSRMPAFATLRRAIEAVNLHFTTGEFDLRGAAGMDSKPVRVASYKRGKSTVGPSRRSRPTRRG